MAKREVVVIGGGPGGYACALRLAKLGALVTLVEKQAVGGTCLNVGCIPSKAMIESAKVHNSVHHANEFGVSVKSGGIVFKEIVKRRLTVVETLTGGVKGLLEHAQVSTVLGEASIRANKVYVQGKQIPADAIIIATGSIQSDLPGVTIDHDFIIDSTDVFNMQTLPKTMAILGGGVIGAEFGYLFNELGTKVTIIEKIERLVFHEDAEISKELFRYFTRQGITCHFNTSIQRIDKNKITIEKEGHVEVIPATVFLVAVGRRPNTAWLKDSGILLDDHGFVKVNRKLETTTKGIFAIGDVVYGPMLAHRSTHQGLAVADFLMKKNSADAPLVAGAVYTEPQIASVGITEEACQRENIPILIGRFRFVANGKAKCSGHTDGMVKLIAHKKRRILIGAHIIGPQASELIHPLILAVEQKIPLDALKRTVFIHPTLSEAVGEALLDLDGEAIHQ